MTKESFSLIAASLILSGSTFADHGNTSNLTAAQKLKVAAAIKVLQESHVIKNDLNQCLKLDQDIFDLLDSEGAVHRGGSAPMSICPDRQ